MILIHDWHSMGINPNYSINPTPRVTMRCDRCGTTLTLTERDAAVLCPPEADAVAMFREPVKCQKDGAK